MKGKAAASAGRFDRKKVDRSRARLGGRMRSLAGTSGPISSLWMDSWKRYAELYASAVLDTGHRLIQGQGIAPGELLADAVALSYEGVAGAVSFWKKAYGICSSFAEQGEVPSDGLVFFQIDTNTETTSALPLGGVDIAEFERLRATDLVRVGGSESIPKEYVNLSTANGEIWVALQSLGPIMTQLRTGHYRGSIEIVESTTSAFRPLVRVDVELTRA